MEKDVHLSRSLSRAEIEKHLAQVMADEPLLNSLGIGAFGTPKPERMEVLSKRREELWNYVPDIEWCAAWLVENIAPIKSINRRHSSYGLKHLAEKFSPRGYITNGAFIAAAIIAGYRYAIHPQGTDAYFAMSGKSIRALHRARRLS